MNKVKFVEIDSSTKIIDGLKRLVVFKNHNPQIPEGEWVECSARLFVTKKGREAIECDFSGRGHLARFYHGGGDRTWEDWGSRKASNAIFCDAGPTSNGGGCWWELQIMQEGVIPIPAEHANYLDELAEH